MLTAIVSVGKASRAPGITSTIKTICVVSMSHLYIGLTDTPAAVANLQKAILDSALALADRDTDYVWNVETLWQLTAGGVRRDILSSSGHRRMCGGTHVDMSPMNPARFKERIMYQEWK